MKMNYVKLPGSTVDEVPVLALLLFLLIPVAVQGLLTLAGIIPYVGVVFQWLGPILAFFIFFAIGQHAGEKAKRLTPARRALLLGYALVVCTFTFAAPYVAGYYTYPVKVARTVAAEKHVDLTYEQASNDVKALLREETGSDGVIGYAIYSERLQLAARSYGEYVGSQFEDIDDLGGLISAVLNIILHTIPMLLKWALCNKLGFVGEAGLVGLGFWYLFSVALSYVAYWVS
jgi:hypothetical protein